jgi:hypothetical protein
MPIEQTESSDEIKPRKLGPESQIDDFVLVIWMRTDSCIQVEQKHQILDPFFRRQHPFVYTFVRGELISCILSLNIHAYGFTDSCMQVEQKHQTLDPFFRRQHPFVYTFVRGELISCILSLNIHAWVYRFM